MTKKITIGLFSRQEADGTFNRTILQEKDNIAHHIHEFTCAAQAENQEPPEFVLSVSLIPNWNIADNSYDDAAYLALKESFLTELKSQYTELNIYIQDFYTESNLTQDEKEYLHQLASMGSNLDIIKIKAIIDNSDDCHLQLDSNTKIHDYQSLLRKTFYSEIQSDALIANHYTWHSVSANSKIVYTTPTGKITNRLKQCYLEYCHISKNTPNEKDKNTNSVYEKVYAIAFHDAGLTKKFSTTKKEFYQAQPKQTEFRITDDILVAINMSWSEENKDLTDIQTLNRLPSIDVGKATFDFQCFNYLIKKYTSPRLFAQMKMNTATTQEYSLPESQRLLKELNEISNQKLDMSCLVKFYNQTLNSNKTHAVLLINLFPNTLEGNQLTQKLFNCSVTELKQTPRPAKEFDIHQYKFEFKKLTQEEQSNTNPDSQQKLH